MTVFMRKELETANRPTLQFVMPMLQRCDQELKRLEMGGVIHRGPARGTMRPSEYSTVLCAMMRRSPRDNSLVYDLWLAACILHPFLRELQCVHISKRDSYKKLGKDMVLRLYRKMGCIIGCVQLGQTSRRTTSINAVTTDAPAIRSQKQKFDLKDFADSRFAFQSDGDDEELTKYLRMDVLQFGLDKNNFMEDKNAAVAFWSRNRGEFPVLFEVAKRVFAALVSPCTSERVFSTI